MFCGDDERMWVAVRLSSGRATTCHSPGERVMRATVLNHHSVIGSFATNERNAAVRCCRGCAKGCNTREPCVWRNRGAGETPPCLASWRRASSTCPGIIEMGADGKRMEWRLLEVLHHVMSSWHVDDISMKDCCASDQC